MRVRKGTPADLPACYGVMHQSVREGAGRFYTKAQRAAWVPQAEPPATWLDRLGQQHVWVAETRGQIIGFMTLEPDGHLDFAYVAPSHMGTGVAAALHTAVVGWARAGGIPRLHTEASHFARRFFLRAGWQEIAAETVTRNGQDLERFRMILRL